MKKSRIDIFMVEKGYAPSRTKAQDLIKEGLVSIRENMKVKTVLSVSELIDEDRPPEVIIQKNTLDKYVSRGGIKMEAALEHLQLKVEGYGVLDVGISTGGFTDCLLQRGAKLVIGADVGHNQLSQKLKIEPRLKAFEGINAREIHLNSEIIQAMPKEGFDLIVIDISFISLTLVLPSVARLMKKPNGAVLALVKPQFEVGPEGLGKNGIVKNPRLYLEVKEKIATTLKNINLNMIDYFESQIEGKDGNKEFFVYFN